MFKLHKIGGASEWLSVRVAGDGPSVLLVHGIPGSGEVWRKVGEGLVSEGFRVVVPDLLGFGESARPDGSEQLWIPAQVEGLLSALDQLGAESVLLVGHDYGAPIGVTLAARDPSRIRGLVLVAGNLFSDTPIPFPLRTLRMPGIGRAMARVMLSGPSLRMMLRVGAGRHDRVSNPRHYLGDRTQQRSIQTIFGTALRELEHRYAPVEAALPELAVPTIVLWGGEDPFFPPVEGRRAANAIPGAKLRMLEGIGHFIPEEHPTAIIDAVLDLTAEIAG